METTKREIPPIVKANREISKLKEKIKRLRKNNADTLKATSRHNSVKSALLAKIDELEKEARDTESTRRALKAILLDRLGMDEFVRLMNESREYAQTNKNP